MDGESKYYEKYELKERDTCQQRRQREMEKLGPVRTQLLLRAKSIKVIPYDRNIMG